ncbi:MAG: hypothetical protein A2Y77_12670 [Planctomycetes bacterium RBG_13_62_9]|nr:MAG: hypothetical protein A2Y77_12670 [Planctomycetes bacterium RBG_13_62_9]
MNAKKNRQLGGVLVVCLAVVGCGERAAEPSAPATTMNREISLVTPTVGGPSREIPVEEEPARLLEKVELALKDSGVRLVQRGSATDGKWLLGKSLADRNVLVELRPVYPGRSVVKMTVEGGDLLARELLNHLYSRIQERTR